MIDDDSTKQLHRLPQFSDLDLFKHTERRNAGLQACVLYNINSFAKPNLICLLKKLSRTAKRKSLCIRQLHTNSMSFRLCYKTLKLRIGCVRHRYSVLMKK